MSTHAQNSDALDKKSLDAEVSQAARNIGLEARNLLADIEGLIADATTMTQEELAKAKTKLNESIESIKCYFDATDCSMAEKARRGIVITNNYVHEQPWAAIGVSALIGVTVGALLSRRC